MRSVISAGGTRRDGESMVTGDYAHLEHPFADVWAAVFAHRPPRIPSLDGGGEDALALVGARIAGVPVYKHVRLELGTPGVRAGRRRVVLPVHWRPTSLTPLLPDMKGELAFEPCGEARTLMALRVTYRPPAGRLGRMADRAIMRHLASATARDFVFRLAARLEQVLTRSPAPRLDPL